MNHHHKAIRNLTKLVALCVCCVGCGSEEDTSSDPVYLDAPSGSEAVDASLDGAPPLSDMRILDAAPADQGAIAPADQGIVEPADQGVVEPADQGAVAPADQGVVAGDGRLRLATWNVAKLDVVGEGDNPRVEADYTLLRGYVDRLDADIVALQEVRGVTGTQTIFPADAWRAECEARDSGQNVCVVARIDSGWSLTRNPDVVALNVGDDNLRQGLDVTLSKAGYASLRALIVHMKFGCFIGDSDARCATFYEQLAVVEAWIDARVVEGVSYVVLGDFNHFMFADDMAWTEINDGEPEGVALTTSIPQGTPSPCWSDVFDHLIDYIILGSTSAGWLQDSDVIVYDETDFDAYYERLSDHCPLWADFELPAQ